MLISNRKSDLWLVFKALIKMSAMAEMTSNYKALGFVSVCHRQHGADSLSSSVFTCMNVLHKEVDAHLPDPLSVSSDVTVTA